MLFFFHFSKSKLLFSKILKKNHLFLIMNFESCYKLLLHHNYFWSKNFWQWNDSPFKIFWNLHGHAFCFFIFSIWKNTTTLLLMIHLKCTVVHFANLNSSSINKPFLNCVASDVLFLFFQFLIYVYFNEAFVKSFMKKISFHNKNFQK